MAPSNPRATAAEAAPTPTAKLSLAESLQALAPIVPLVAKFQDVYKVIEAGASIEQAIGEAQAAIRDVQAAAAAEAEKLAGIRDEIAKAEAHLVERRAAAQAEADAILQAAKDDAKARKAKIDDAEKRWAEKLGGLEAASADLVKQRKTAEVELAEVQGKLDAARQAAAEAAAKILGGG